MSKKKKSEPEQAVHAEVMSAKEVLETVIVRNNFNQLIAFNIKRPDGKMVGIQIDANSFVTWQRLPDYGPDTDRLIKRKVLRLETGK